MEVRKQNLRRKNRGFSSFGSCEHTEKNGCVSCRLWLLINKCSECPSSLTHACSIGLCWPPFFLVPSPDSFHLSSPWPNAGSEFFNCPLNVTTFPKIFCSWLSLIKFLFYVIQLNKLNIHLELIDVQHWAMHRRLEGCVYRLFHSVFNVKKVFSGRYRKPYIFFLFFRIHNLGDLKVFKST